MCVSAALNPGSTSLPKSVHEVASTYANLACPSGAPQSTPDVCRSEGSFATLLEAGSHTRPGQALWPSLLMILESLFLCSPGITKVEICPKHTSLLPTSLSYTHTHTPTIGCLQLVCVGKQRRNHAIVSLAKITTPPVASISHSGSSPFPVVVNGVNHNDVPFVQV